MTKCYFTFIILPICCLFSLQAISQNDIVPSESITVTGKIKNEISISIDEIEKLESKEIGDLTIYNHKGEVKSTMTGMHGVPLKTMIEKVEIDCDNAKLLSEFYFVLEATDHYKVVLSWNEIFNNDIGDQFYIVTKMDGKKISELAQRIMFVSMTDQKTGRRYVKGLTRIEVCRAG